MIAKSERFEMRLDTELIDRVDHWRSSQNDVPSRAEAVRRLLEVALSAVPDDDLKLKKPERLMVWMLSEILKCQKGYDNQDKVKLIQEVIYGGHFWSLEWEMQDVLHNQTDTKEALSFVVDTMDMWGFIERAYANFRPEEILKLESEVKFIGKDPKFIGFDGNNESEYFHIARFLVEKLDRFQEFTGRSLNSHSPTLERYRAMYSEFEPIRTKLIGRELSVEEFIAIMGHE
jgi:uncharacterized protein